MAIRPLLRRLANSSTGVRFITPRRVAMMRNLPVSSAPLGSGSIAVVKGAFTVPGDGSLDFEVLVKALAAKLGISEPAVSQQLQVLKDCGLVTGERLDYQMHYRVDRTRLEQAVRAVAPLLSACQVPQSRLENCACEFAGTCSRRKAGKKA